MFCSKNSSNLWLLVLKSMLDITVITYCNACTCSNLSNRKCVHVIANYGACFFKIFFLNVICNIFRFSFLIVYSLRKDICYSSALLHYQSSTKDSSDTVFAFLHYTTVFYNCNYIIMIFDSWIIFIILESLCSIPYHFLIMVKTIYTVIF